MREIEHRDDGDERLELDVGGEAAARDVGALAEP